MKLFFKKIYGSLLASVIERAYKSDKYNRCQYLCPILIHTLLGHLARKHLLNILGPLYHLNHAHANPLLFRLNDYNHGFMVLGWESRKIYHVEYYRLMCAELRKGNLTWGSKEDCKEVFDNLPPFAEPWP